MNQLRNQKLLEFIESSHSHNLIEVGAKMTGLIVTGDTDEHVLFRDIVTDNYQVNIRESLTVCLTYRSEAARDKGEILFSSNMDFVKNAKDIEITSFKYGDTSLVFTLEEISPADLVSIIYP